ncbi:hypothetical protein ACHAXA_001634 [Cyclostephanos tholiformis]|uniref:EamA domain-containing protein n=1 Tax=Cyclostephanos tholiformis TaxID=382380 RepID=A0ABD3RVB0_9STRA
MTTTTRTAAISIDRHHRPPSFLRRRRRNVGDGSSRHNMAAMTTTIVIHPLQSHHGAPTSPPPSRAMRRCYHHRGGGRGIVAAMSRCSASTSPLYAVVGGGGGEGGGRGDGGGGVTDYDRDRRSSMGRACLVLVSLLYGTLNVTLRGIYNTDGPPIASALSLVRQCLSLFAFLPIFFFASSSSSSSSSSLSSSPEEDDTEVERPSMIRGDVDDDDDGVAVGEVAGEKVRPMWSSAMELAFWNFGAQGLVSAGLLVSPAARASFLTQTSVVMTPLISAMAGERIKASVWGGCALALFGLFLISTSAGGSTAAMTSTAFFFDRGDLMILLGALSWSTYIFRTSRLAGSYPELDLQFAKTALLAVMYGAWFALDAASTLAAAGVIVASSPSSPDGWAETLTPLWSGWNSSLLVWMLLIYSAIGPGAIADLLQQRGQRETSASESNVILCMESVFAAVCAYAFLGEVSSIREIAGGGLIVIAAILASR